MISFDEAQAILARHARLLGEERVPLAEAAGRILTREIRATTAAPRFAVSERDGYAVKLAEVSDGTALALRGENRPGSSDPGRLSNGEARRVFTGAPVPVGADCVIMQEYALVDNGAVRFTEGHGPARHIRAAGSDFAAGDVLVAAGTLLDHRTLVAAAAADVAETVVARRPRVAIIATGDELREPGSSEGPAGSVPDSVSLALAAMVIAGGGVTVSSTIGGDDLAALAATAGEALAAADVVVVTGGASVGDRDFAKPMFTAHGLELVFDKVAIKPGRPVWLGKAGRGTSVLGLPGNPTSALVTAALFLRPLLFGLQGGTARHHWRKLPLASALPPPGPRETFLRARWGDEGLEPLANQDSGAQAPLAAADWLIRRPANAPACERGEQVPALAF